MIAIAYAIRNSQHAEGEGTSGQESNPSTGRQAGRRTGPGTKNGLGGRESMKADATPETAALAERLRLLPTDPGQPFAIPALLHPLLSVERMQRQSRVETARVWLEYRLLALLAHSGWSLRWALTAWEAQQRGIGPKSGSVKRAVRRLEACAWQSRTVRTVGTYTLVRLSPEARSRLCDVGIEPVESEWERIERLHRGDTSLQSKHTAALCAFAWQARRRGWSTEVCPELDDPFAEPDILLHRGDEQLYVEVQRRGGSRYGRMAKWSNLARIQGFVAACLMTPEALHYTRRELSSLHHRRMLLTDLHTLRYVEPAALWVQEYGMEDQQIPF